MTPNETAVLLRCSDTARGLVHHVLGFYDEDLAQDAREAMCIAVATYDPDQGASLKTWLMMKGKYGIVDAFRLQRGRSDGDHKPRPRPISIEATMNDDPHVRDRIGQVDPYFVELDEQSYITEKLEQLMPVETALSFFSERDAAMIRKRLAGGKGNKIAEEFGLTESRFSQVFGRFRRRMTSGIGGKRPRVQPVPVARQVKLSDTEALTLFTGPQHEIIEHHLAGEDNAAIAFEMDVRGSEVSKVLKDFRHARDIEPEHVDCIGIKETLRLFNGRDQAIICERLAGVQNLVVAGHFNLTTMRISQIYGDFKDELYIREERLAS